MEVLSEARPHIDGLLRSFFGTASRPDRSPSLLNQSVIFACGRSTGALRIRRSKRTAAFPGLPVKGDGFADTANAPYVPYSDGARAWIGRPADLTKAICRPRAGTRRCLRESAGSVRDEDFGILTGP